MHYQLWGSVRFIFAVANAYQAKSIFFGAYFFLQSWSLNLMHQLYYGVFACCVWKIHFDYSIRVIVSGILILSDLITRMVRIFVSAIDARPLTPLQFVSALIPKEISSTMIWSICQVNPRPWTLTTTTGMGHYSNNKKQTHHIDVSSFVLLFSNKVWLCFRGFLLEY